MSKKRRTPTPKKARFRVPKPINNASFPTMQTLHGVLHGVLHEAFTTGKKNVKLWYDYSTVNEFNIYIKWISQMRCMAGSCQLSAHAYRTAKVASSPCLF